MVKIAEQYRAVRTTKFQAREADRRRGIRTGEGSVYKLRRRHDYAKTARKNALKALAEVTKAVQDAETAKANIEREISDLRLELGHLQTDVLAEAAHFEVFENLTSGDCQDRQTALKCRQKHLAKEGKAVIVAGGWDKTSKALHNSSKQILRCFNQECDSLIWPVTSKTSDSARIRIFKSFEYLNHIFSTSGVALSEDLLKMKQEELNLIHAYKIKLENEKEEKRIRIALKTGK